MDYAIKAHAETNHFYDKYLPYDFHLRMVVRNGEKFIHLVSNDNQESVINGCWCHDLIEDTRQSYNDVLENTSYETAEIVRVCTNLTRGRNRAERMPDWIYKDIKETPNALFVKLCDRIANCQYSRMTGSSMFTKYQKEHAHFKEMLYTKGYLQVMWDYLEEVLYS